MNRSGARSRTVPMWSLRGSRRRLPVARWRIRSARPSRCSRDDEVFVIGGAQIYAQALPLADRFYLTRVFRAYEGDTHFPEWDEAQWRLLSSESFASGANYPYPFAFETYERRRN